MTNPTIKTDIAEVLKRIEGKQDKTIEKLNEIDKRLVKVETETLEIKEDVKELKGSQNKQIWALILLAFTAVVSLLVGLGKFIFFPNS